MKTSNVGEIFEFLQFKKVAIVYSVPFCLKLAGIQISDLAMYCGVSRTFFHQVLAGKRRPNERIRKGLGGLGIHPWEGKTLELSGLPGLPDGKEDTGERNFKIIGG